MVSDSILTRGNKVVSNYPCTGNLLIFYQSSRMVYSLWEAARQHCRAKLTFPSTTSKKNVRMRHNTGL